MKNTSYKVTEWELKMAVAFYAIFMSDLKDDC